MQGSKLRNAIMLTASLFALSRNKPIMFQPPDPRAFMLGQASHFLHASPNQKGCVFNPIPHQHNRDSSMDAVSTIL